MVANCAIWWIRRDLRLADNQALNAALSSANKVIPLFILDPKLLSSRNVGARRTAFLFDGLRALDRDLRAAGSRLIVRKGEPVKALVEVLQESGATAVYAEEDFSPYARQRDAGVQKVLPLKLRGGLTVHPPDLVLKKDGRPYTVFTPFSKAWKKLPLPQMGNLLTPPDALQPPPNLSSLPIPGETGISNNHIFPAGESEALRRLIDFTTGSNPAIYRYQERRNRPDIEGTSSLSPYFRFGMLPIRQAVTAAAQAIDRSPDAQSRKGAGTWLNELIWREFYLSILYHFPHVLQRSFRAQYDAIPWVNDIQAFEAWCAGRTGYPIVDAAMRQLKQTGWMHNRTRMISASFLVKDLLIDWRWGERYFMQHLIDGDPAANNGGWQWTAGTGTDAAPYFRIFNPILQSKKFDPHGRYIRQWLPELSAVLDRYIHEPWKMDEELQKAAKCRIGQDYAPPIIDHGAARERALAAYKRSKEGV